MDQKQISNIIRILRENPRGMTVTQISDAIGLNRNSVAKYLEVLLISGKVEMRSYGPAKVFFLSQRIPVSNLINFSSDYIAIFDRNLKVIQANEVFLKLLNAKRDEIIEQRLEDTSFCAFITPEMKIKMKSALRGKKIKTEIKYSIGKRPFHCDLKLIPITFENGLPGITLILEDKTKYKQMEKKFSQLSNAMRFAIDSILILDVNTKILDVNEAALKLFEVDTKKQLIGKKFSDLIISENHKNVSEILKEILKMRKHIIKIFRAITEDGTIKLVEVSLGLIKNADDELIGIIVIARER